jgi:AraC-like DNA-binding protein
LSPLATLLWPLAVLPTPIAVLKVLLAALLTPTAVLPPIPLAAALAPIATPPLLLALALLPQAVLMGLPPSDPAGLLPTPPLLHSTACAAEGMSSGAASNAQPRMKHETRRPLGASSDRRSRECPSTTLVATPAVKLIICLRLFQMPATRGARGIVLASFPLFPGALPAHRPPQDRRSQCKEAIFKGLGQAALRTDCAALSCDLNGLLRSCYKWRCTEALRPSLHRMLLRIGRPGLPSKRFHLSAKQSATALWSKTPMQRLRISTSEFPENKRLSMWREVYGRTILNTDIEPIGDAPFHAEAVLTTLPDVVISKNWRSPAHYHVTREHTNRGSDAVFIAILDHGNVAVTQLGRTQMFGAGSAVVVMADHPWSGSLLSEGGFTYLALPRPIMTSLVPILTSMAGTVVASANPALRLLRRYLDLVTADDTLYGNAIAQSVSTHILDLAALALGAHGDAAEIARLRGAKAARLAAIRSDIVANLGHGNLSPDKIAAAHGISPRYIRKLFEEQGSSFSSFVLTERLTKVRRMLADRRYAHLTIAQIALEAGFGDLSYFNRAFRRYFGATPSDFRAMKE